MAAKRRCGYCSGDLRMFLSISPCRFGCLIKVSPTRSYELSSLEDCCRISQYSPVLYCSFSAIRRIVTSLPEASAKGISMIAQLGVLCHLLASKALSRRAKITSAFPANIVPVTAIPERTMYAPGCNRARGATLTGSHQSSTTIARERFCPK